MSDLTVGQMWWRTDGRTGQKIGCKIESISGDTITYSILDGQKRKDYRLDTQGFIGYYSGGYSGMWKEKVVKNAEY